MFRPIQESALLYTLPDASTHLQGALNLFAEAFRKSNATAQRKMLITEMFPKRPYVFLLTQFCQFKLVPARNSAESIVLY